MGRFLVDQHEADVRDRALTSLDWWLAGDTRMWYFVGQNKW